MKKEKFTPKVGDILKDCYSYVAVVEANDNDFMLQRLELIDPNSHPGTYVDLDYINEFYEPVSLKPDFRDAKVGEKVFSIMEGMIEISDIKENATYPIVGEMINYDHDGYFSVKNDHPILFNSWQQAEAYFMDLFRRIREGEENINE